MGGEVGHDVAVVVVVVVVFDVRLRSLDANQRNGRTDDSRPSCYIDAVCILFFYLYLYAGEKNKQYFLQEF